MKNVKTIIGIAIGILSVLSANFAHAAHKTPQEIFAQSKSRVNDIPENWVTENQLINNVCFNLKYEINSKEADAFLDDLYLTISSMKYELDVEVYRSLYPAELDYCVMLTFENWDAYMDFETSEEFLSFYHARWKGTVTKTSEHRIILDKRAGRKTK